MKIWAHRYELVPRAKGSPVRKGALLKVEWALGRWGYSDLHPWPEFGEPALADHLVAFAEGRVTSLVERSLAFNRVDHAYRAVQRNAFLGLILPRSHKLVLDILNLTGDQLREWREMGFSHVKVKIGKRLEEETDALADLVRSSDCLWRLDLNGRLSVAEFTDWWSSLDSEVKSRVDFVEDPVAQGRLNLQGPWADDWKPQECARIRVLKPARESLVDLDVYRRVIFTHSLDHPMGQAAALWTAANFYSLRPKLTEACGLAGVDAYEKDEFSRLWFCEGPRLKPTMGIGFGFNVVLEELPWERVF
jgi:O-succinylbenzoate synthase